MSGNIYDFIGYSEWCRNNSIKLFGKDYLDKFAKICEDIKNTPNKHSFVVLDTLGEVLRS